MDNEVCDWQSTGDQILWNFQAYLVPVKPEITCRKNHIELFFSDNKKGADALIVRFVRRIQLEIGYAYETKGGGINYGDVLEQIKNSRNQKAPGRSIQPAHFSRFFKVFINWRVAIKIVIIAIAGSIQPYKETSHPEITREDNQMTL